ncbi:MAG TPA: hypothetical protein VET88_06440, partial [Gammaproteobacteria bacterium]|nr:hypothetical protein [Gammaproteobacteria bacterium]
SRARDTPEVPAAVLSEEVAAQTGLDVRVEAWQPGETAAELQALARVDRRHFTEVLNRLALSAAALFFDRYHKPVDRDDVDWDNLEFANDFRHALDYCGLDWGDIDRESCMASYVETMHAETRRLAAGRESPMVGPEGD